MSVQSCTAKVVTFKYDKFPKFFTHTRNITQQLKYSKPYIKRLITLNIFGVNLNPYTVNVSKLLLKVKATHFFTYIFAVPQ